MDKLNMILKMKEKLRLAEMKGSKKNQHIMDAG